jgi:hypothetical protein
MENKKEKLLVNNYIVFKNGSESLEGRIKSISIEGTTEAYQVLCFSNFTEMKVNSHDVFVNVSQEVKRKVKSAAYHEIPDSIYFPQILMNILVVDKEWSVENTYDLPNKNNVNLLFKQFKDYLINTASTCDNDEGTEAIKGLTSCFNGLFLKYLIYNNEASQMTTFEDEPAEYCGPVHVLRLIYFLHKNANVLIPDESIRNIVLDYTIYLLDFFLFKFKELF